MKSFSIVLAGLWYLSLIQKDVATWRTWRYHSGGVTMAVDFSGGSLPWRRRRILQRRRRISPAAVPAANLVLNRRCRELVRILQKRKLIGRTLRVEFIFEKCVEASRILKIGLLPVGFVIKLSCKYKKVLRVPDNLSTV